MRQIAIIGAFLAGFAGLCMSVCGGGFFVMFALDAAKNIFRSGQPNQLIGMLVFLAIPAAFTVGGALLFWACFKTIRRRVAKSQENGREP
jgi:Na+/melibiose symporter-like transporter